MLVGFYGTLRYADAVSALQAKGCKRMGQALIPATMYDLGAFPGIKMGSGQTVIDIFHIPEDKEYQILRGLDAYEGYRETDPEGSLYVREAVPVRLAEEPMPQLVEVYIYNHPTESHPAVPSGDWLQHVKERSYESRAN